MTSMHTAQWKAMIKDTILKELRSKTLIFIFIATTLMILLAHSLLKMFIEGNDAASGILITGNNSLTLMFYLINAWSVVIAGIFGISSIRSDFKDKIIYQYLSFPISRTQYMFSRIFGTWILVYGYYLYSYLLSAFLFSMATNSLALDWTHLISMLLMGLYVLLIIFISFLFSMIAGKIPAFLMLIATVVTISYASNTMKAITFADYFKEVGVFKLLGMLVYFCLPRINYVTELANAVMTKEAIKLNIPLEAAHFVVTSAVLVFVATYLVKRKNF